MFKENISQEFRLKNIKETRNYFIKEIDKNGLMSKKCKKGFTILNYIEHFLILAFAITGCVLINDFAFLPGISIGITNSTIGLEIFAKTAEIVEKV